MEPPGTTFEAEVAGGLRVASRDEALREVYLAHYPRLAGWCAHLVGDRDLGHEFATEAFTRLLSRWQVVDDPRAWLYMTTNLVRDHWRRTQRERRAFQQIATQPEYEAASDPSIRDLVERLPKRLRSVVLLHYYADLPVREVAAVLGKAEGSVKRALFDARARLHADLEGTR